MKNKTRNYNIDFLRGIATISVIIIHTTWWSGNMYLPSWFRNISLLVDVPAFIFISGITFHYSNSIMKSLKNIYEQWKKWLYFLIYYALILLVFFNSEFKINEIFSWIVYYFPKENSLQAVAGSVWFMLLFIKVSLICSIIICAVNKFLINEIERKQCFKYILFTLLFIFTYTSMSKVNFIIDSELSFYLLIYILGYYLSDYKIKSKEFILMEIINLIILIIIFKILNINITSIQSIKFPPYLPYLFFSLISIILFLYLKNVLNINSNNRIVFIGKNAIFYFYAQGISSSLIYFIYPQISNLNVWLIFSIMLVINILLSLSFGTFFCRTYKFINNKIKFINLFANK